MSWDFALKHYQELSKEELFDLAKLRIDVFIVEQHCPYPDLEELDQNCHHFLGKNKDQLGLYARLIATENPAIKKLGRIIVSPEFRPQKVGKLLMTEALQATKSAFPETEQIVISAQQAIVSFYQSVGFIPEGDIYLEDRIPHIKMVYSY
ncbi:GNAT family N-acetyltransferase [Persicobacter diffluens]|uniref:GNAT family acetyltransferase n=1 Tax=Persicobacter diffluens TaxID=981 RepID=A0AAN4VWI1_9BACT|nr:GNAT family acetyltransferase [Persicobacter diffluens]